MVIDYSVYLLLIAFVKGTLFPTVQKYLKTYLWASLRNSQPVSSSSVALTARSRTFCWSTVFATALKTNLWMAFLFYFLPAQLNLKLTWQPCTDRRFSRPPWRAPLRSWRPCWPPTPCGSGWEPGSGRLHHLFAIFVFFCILHVNNWGSLYTLLFTFFGFRQNK